MSFLVVWALCPLVLIPMTIVFGVQKSNLNKKVKFMENLIASLTQEKQELLKRLGENQTETTTADIPQETEIKQETVTYQQQPNPPNTEVHKLPEIVKKEKPLRQRKKVSSINIVLIIGTLLILTAGTVFATTAWQSVNGLVKTCLIFSACVFFFGMCAFSEKKLKLERTATAFFSIGAFLFPVSVIATGWLGLFGEKFSFSDGRNSLLVMAVTMLAMFITGGAGAKKYNNKFYIYISLLSFSTSFSLFAKYLTYGNGQIFSMIISLYCGAVMTLEKKFRPKLSEKSEDLEKVLSIFSVFNGVALGTVCIIFSGYGIVSGIAFLILSGAFISRNINDSSEKSFESVASSFFIMIGFIKIISPDSSEGFLWLAVACGTVLILLGEMNVLSDYAKQIFKVASIIFITAQTVLALMVTGVNWSIGTYTAICFAVVGTAKLLIKDRNPYIIICHNILLGTLVIGIMQSVHTDMIKVVLGSAVCAAVFFTYKLIPPLSNRFSEVCFSEFPAVLGIVYGEPVGVCISIILMYFETKDGRHKIQNIIFTVFLIISLVILNPNRTLYIDNMSMISMTVAYILISTAKHTSNIYKTCSAISVTLSMCIIGNYIGFERSSLIIAVISYILFAAIRHIKKLDKFRSQTSEIILMVSVLVNGYSLMEAEHYFSVIISGALITIMALEKAVKDENGRITSLMSWIASIVILATSYFWVQFLINTETNLYTYKMLLESVSIVHFMAFAIFCTVMAIIFDKCEICGRLKRAFETNFILYGILLQFIFANPFSEERSGTPYLWIILAYSVICVFIAVRSEFKISTNFYSYFSVVMLISAVLVTGETDLEITVIKFSCICISVFVSFLISHLTMFMKQVENPLRISSIILMPIASVTSSLLYLMNGSKIIYFAFAMMVISFAYFAGHFSKTNVTSLISAILFFLLNERLFSAIALNKESEIIGNTIIFFVLIFIGRLAYRKIVRTDGKYYIDWLTIVSAVFPIVILSYGADSTAWFMFSVWLFMFVRRTNKDDRIFMTLSVASLCMVVWTQHLIEIPPVIRTEVKMLPVMVLGLVTAYIWKEKNGIIPFGATVLVLVILSADAMQTHMVADALILIGISLIIFFISFTVKQKKWFILSVISITFLTVYMTKGFWSSVAWWIYLLTAGIILILLAGANEYLKQHDETLKQKFEAWLSRFFVDWQW